MDDFETIAAQLRRDTRWEHAGEAREVVDAAVRSRSFSDHLRGIPVGDLITLTTLDGSSLSGRILAVGADWLRVGETEIGDGSCRARVRRIHDVWLGAVARISAEAR